MGSKDTAVTGSAGMGVFVGTGVNVGGMSVGMAVAVSEAGTAVAVLVGGAVGGTAVTITGVIPDSVTSGLVPTQPVMAIPKKSSPTSKKCLIFKIQLEQ